MADSEFSIHALTVVARRDIESLWKEVGWGASRDPQCASELERLARLHAIELSMASEYLSRLDMVWGQRENYAVFVYAGEGGRRPRPFGVRTGTGFLPRETFPFGFLTKGRAVLRVPPLVDPYLNMEFRRAVIEALLEAGEMNAEDKLNNLIEEGYVETKRYEGIL